MKKVLLLFAAMCCMMVANAQTQLDNEIWYVSSDKQVINPSSNAFGGATIQSNEYDAVANKGVIKFDTDLTVIGDNAFTSCKKLTSIILPGSITEIGYLAFANTGLTSITLPSSITKIKTTAFDHCESLTSITLPSSLTIIESTVFGNCKSLTSIKLPSSITNIYNYAFVNCENLKSITLPSHLQSIDATAFQGCTGLESITVLSSTCPTLSPWSYFYNVNNFIPVYVPDVEAYNGWGGFTNLIAIEIDKFKQDAIDEINAAKDGVSLTEDEQTAINGYIQTIKNVESLSDENLTTVENTKNDALAIINQAAIRTARKAALAAIEAAMQGETSAYLTALAQQYIGIINTATDVTAINNARNTALEVLTSAKGAYQSGKTDAFGSLGEKQNGPALIVTDKDDKEIILYSPKSVEYIKVNEE